MNTHVLSTSGEHGIGWTAYCLGSGGSAMWPRWACTVRDNSNITLGCSYASVTSPPTQPKDSIAWVVLPPLPPPQYHHCKWCFSTYTPALAFPCSYRVHKLQAQCVLAHKVSQKNFLETSVRRFGGQSVRKVASIPFIVAMPRMGR